MTVFSWLWNAGNLCCTTKTVYKCFGEFIVKENLSEAGFKYFKELPLVENNLGIHEET